MLISRNVWASGLSMLVLVILATGAGSSVAADDIPDRIRGELEDVLRKKSSQLLGQQNEEGVSFKRGNYSKSFKKVDDSTYQVTFNQQTAAKEQLKTERYLLTLKKDGSGKWSIAKEDLQDTYDGLYRGSPGDEEWYKFSKLSFDREGLKVTATNGSLYKDFFQGKTSRFVLAASDLAFEYAPPKELDFYQLHQKFMLKKYPEDFAFKPQRVTIYCDPASCDVLESSIFTGLQKATIADADPRLRSEYEDAKGETEKNLKENYFGGFRIPPESDRTAYTVAIKKDSAKDYSVWLDYDNYEPWEVTFSTTGRGAVFAYYSEATRKSNASPYDLESRGDYDARNYEIDGLKGTVDLALDDPEAISGDITYQMTIKRQLRELPFSISRLRFQGEESKDTKDPRMFINSIQDGDGNELTWTKLGAFGGVVIFPRPLAAGNKVTVRMQFQSQDSIYKLNPSYSYVDRSGWLPFVRFGDFIDSFDLTTRIPDKYTALGVGKKASESRQNGVLTTRWVSDSPVTFPTVIFGEYLTDAPQIKATKTDGKEIPVHVYVDKISTSSVESASDVAGGAAQIRGSQLKALGDQAVNALNLYREIYGVDYPFAKLDLVNAPFEGGAQSPASIIYLGSFLFRGEGALASQSGRSASYIAKFIKDTVAHETAHQWWGAVVTNANFRNYWFVESLAEYSSALYVENVYGKKKYLEKVQDWRRNILEIDMLDSVQNAAVMWGGEKAFSAYVANVYNKGPYAFHILRETFGDDKFFPFLKALAQQLKGKEIVTRDIQNVAEKSFGVSMDWFFDQWIRSAGIPQYALFYNVRKTEDGKFLVEGKIKQRVTVGLDKTELPGIFYKGLGHLTFILQNGKEFTYPKPIKVDGPETPFVLKLSEEPADVAFNKYGELLAADVLVNRSW